MSRVIEINRKKVFSHLEVSQLLPIVYRMTEEAQGQAKKILNCIDALADKNSSAAKDLENRLNDLVNKWQLKIEKLGAEPKGLWLADFDSGDGYFCWKYPETEVRHWHGYQDGFTGRILISEKNGSSHENSNSPNQPHTW